MRLSFYSGMLSLAIIAADEAAKATTLISDNELATTLVT